MKRIMFALAALCCVPPAFAEWMTFMKSDTGVIYIDPASVRSEGHSRKASVLVDLARKDSDGVRSKRGQSEIDCQKDRLRIHDLSGFTGAMASGVAVYAFKGSSEWIPIPPQSALWNTVRLLCGRPSR
jgi:hypothetical protein